MVYPAMIVPNSHCATGVLCFVAICAFKSGEQIAERQTTVRVRQSALAARICRHVRNGDFHREAALSA
jgi:hypothetical protein